LSISQSASLAATGVIWSRYSLVIIPKNYGLFSVNVFVALTQIFQLYRAYAFQKDLEKKALNAGNLQAIEN
jgi:mitochondrial pyruvate carrier 2